MEKPVNKVEGEKLSASQQQNIKNAMKTNPRMVLKEMLKTLADLLKTVNKAGEV